MHKYFVKYWVTITFKTQHCCRKWLKTLWLPTIRTDQAELSGMRIIGSLHVYMPKLLPTELYTIYEPSLQSEGQGIWDFILELIIVIDDIWNTCFKKNPKNDSICMDEIGHWLQMTLNIIFLLFIIHINCKGNKSKCQYEKILSDLNYF